MTPSKTVEFDYPGCKGFRVSLCYLAREELIKLRTRCVTQVFNKKTRSYQEELDDDKFLTEYTKAVVKGWNGFQLSYAKNMLQLADLSPEQETQELEITQDNVEVLMKNSIDFDWFGFQKKFNELFYHDGHLFGQKICGDDDEEQPIQLAHFGKQGCPL